MQADIHYEIDYEALAIQSMVAIKNFLDTDPEYNSGNAAQVDALRGILRDYVAVAAKVSAVQREPWNMSLSDDPIRFQKGFRGR